MMTEFLHQKEKRQHSSVLIPYSIYECSLPDSIPNVPMHWHGEFELNYILHGSGNFICGDEHFQLNQGDIIIISPNMLHAAYPISDLDLKYIAFVFHPNMLGMDNNDRSSMQGILPIISDQMFAKLKHNTNQSEYSSSKELIEKIIHYAYKNNYLDDLMLKSLLFQLFWNLKSNGNLHSGKNNFVSYSSLIRPALEYMVLHFNNPITIKTLASISAISASHFMSVFNKAVGCSAIEYLTQLRIQAACRALIQTETAISTISFDCGYSNLSNFNRHFRKITGISPREYRKRRMAD